MASLRVGVVVLLCHVSLTVAGPADELLAQARRFRAEQTLDLALARLDTFLARYPTDPRVPEVELGRFELMLRQMRYSDRLTGLQTGIREYAFRNAGTLYEARARLLLAQAERDSTDGIGAAGERRTAVEVARSVCGDHPTGRSAAALADVLYAAGSAHWQRDPRLLATEARAWLLEAANLHGSAETSAAAWLALARLTERLVDPPNRKSDGRAIEAAWQARRQEAEAIRLRVVKVYPDSQSAATALAQLIYSGSRDDGAAGLRRARCIEFLRRYPNHRQAAQVARSRYWLEQEIVGLDDWYDWRSVLPGQDVSADVLCQNVRSLDCQLYRLTLAQADDYPEAGIGVTMRRWRVAVPGYLPYEDRTVVVRMAGLPSGIYALRVSSGKSAAQWDYGILEVTAVAVVVQEDERGLAVHAVRRSDGSPVPNAELTVTWSAEVGVEPESEPPNDMAPAAATISNAPAPITEPKVLHARSGPDGRVLVPRPDDERYKLYRVVARDGDDVAALGGSVSRREHEPPSLLGRIITDRVYYLPGHTVHYCGFVRRYDARPINLPETDLKLAIRDPRGQLVDERTLRTNRFGSAAGSLALPADAARGGYTIRMSLGGSSVYGGFQVEDYRKNEMVLSVETPGAVVTPGEQVAATVRATYLFGAAVTGAGVEYWVRSLARRPTDPFRDRRPRWMTLAPGFPGFDGYGPTQHGRGVTDHNGELKIRIVTGDDGEDREYRIHARVIDHTRRMQRTNGRFQVRSPGAWLFAETDRRVYRTGETVKLAVAGRDHLSRPVAIPASVSCYSLRWQPANEEDLDEHPEWIAGFRRVAEVVEGRQTAGRAEDEIQFPAPAPGCYQIVVRGADPLGAGAPLAATTGFWVAGPDGELAHSLKSAHLVMDRASYQPGETARVLVLAPTAPSALYLTSSTTPSSPATTERLSRTSALLAVPVPDPCRKHLFLAALVLGGSKAWRAETAASVQQPNRAVTVRVTADRDSYRFGDQGRLTVETRDPTGRPVTAQVALGVADEGVMALSPDRPEPVLFQTDWEYGNGPAHPETSEIGAEEARMESAAVEAIAVLDDILPLDRWLDPPNWPSNRDMNAAAAAALLYSKRIESLSNGTASSLPLPVRANFPDTILWEPTLVTDEHGRAEVPITFPDTLTTWRATATAVTEDSLSGVGVHKVVTTKDLVMRLAVPRTLCQLDRGTISALVTNRSDQAERVEVTLAVDGAELRGRPTETVDVPAGGVRRIDRELVADTAGEVAVTVAGRGQRDGDALKQTFKVLPHGAQVQVGAGGMATNGAPGRAMLALPSEHRAESTGLAIEVSPTLVAGLLDALPYLVNYPYGCTEQKLSALLPAAMVARIIGYTSRANSDGRVPQAPECWRKRSLADLPGMLAAGVAAIGDRNADGGYGWFSGMRSDPYLTAYFLQAVVELRLTGHGEILGLGTAEITGVHPSSPDLPPDAGWSPAPIPYLYRRLSAIDDVNELAYIAWVLRRAAHLGLKPADKSAPNQLRQAIERVYSRRAELTDTGRALLVLCLAGQSAERAQVAWRNLVSRRIATDEGVHWGEPRWGECWYDNRVTATSAALRAALVMDPRGDLAGKAAAWLMANRTGCRWENTKVTADAILVLAEYAAAHHELQTSAVVVVKLNDQEVRKIAVTPAEALTVDGRVELGADLLKPGDNRVEVTVEGDGRVYWSAALSTYTSEDPIRARGRHLAVAREYRKVIEDEAGKETFTPLKPGEAVRSGDEVEVELRVTADNDMSYVAIRDPRPAGLEREDINSGATWCGAWCYRELREAETVFFLDKLWQGETRLTYRLRAEAPGTFRALPPDAFAMYRPAARGTGDEAVITVGER